MDKIKLKNEINDMVVGVRMPNELVLKIKKLAKDNGISFSAQVKMILSNYFNK